MNDETNRLIKELQIRADVTNIYLGRLVDAAEAERSPRTDNMSATERESAWAALRMIADCVGERFGPIANIESEDASLRRGPEYCHFAEGIIEALLRVPSQQQDDLTISMLKTSLRAVSKQLNDATDLLRRVHNIDALNPIDRTYVGICVAKFIEEVDQS